MSTVCSAVKNMLIGAGWTLVGFAAAVGLYLLVTAVLP